MQSALQNFDYWKSQLVEYCSVRVYQMYYWSKKNFENVK